MFFLLLTRTCKLSSMFVSTLRSLFNLHVCVRSHVSRITSLIFNVQYITRRVLPLSSVVTGRDGLVSVTRLYTKSMQRRD